LFLFDIHCSGLYFDQHVLNLNPKIFIHGKMFTQFLSLLGVVFELTSDDIDARWKSNTEQTRFFSSQLGSDWCAI